MNKTFSETANRHYQNRALLTHGRRAADPAPKNETVMGGLVTIAAAVTLSGGISFIGAYLYFGWPF